MPLDGYAGRIGRYTPALAQEMIRASGIAPGQRVLDVGCGSGALTVPLAELVGAENVAGVDPSPDALAACRGALPDVELHQAWAEKLPFEDDRFDAVVAQLVVSLMEDAPAGAREMRRVARPTAPVCACSWDFGEGMTVLRAFWDCAREVDPRGVDEHDQAKTHPYATAKELRSLWEGAGLEEVAVGELSVSAGYLDFEDLWEPMTIPDGGPGIFFVTLTPAQQARLRELLWERLGRPQGPFRLDARAWYAIGRA
jgi:SAM-dependent methyltransferase